MVYEEEIKMLESLFIVMVLIGFLMTIYAHEKQSIIFGTSCVILWVFIMVNALWVQVSFSTGYEEFAEYAFSVFCLIFIFINVIQTLWFVMDWRTQKELM